MQIKGLHKNIYKLYSYARTQDCYDAYRQKYVLNVNMWEKLKTEEVSDKLCQEIVGISKSTYYRSKKILNDLLWGIIPPSKRPKRLNTPHWTDEHKRLVLNIRRNNPTYGRKKIAIILKRDHAVELSESTVGRIICMLKNKGLIQKSLSAWRVKRARDFRKGHAQPWAFKKYEAMELGERVQIDHMTVTKNGIGFKHFQAWERKSRFMHAQIYCHAKSSSAKRFLLELIEKVPFNIRSIQVDGGSEFMAEFEEACREFNIPLIVLPPRKPQYNGGVERGNRIFREEFYARKDILSDSLGAMRYDLAKAVDKYNTYRPHSFLNGFTPMQYIQNIYPEVLTQSHFT